jgi:hypothetical protein
MSLLVAAVGAVLASLLETSVLPELHLPIDLVLVFAVTSAMLLSIEEGLTWAFLGGISLDLLVAGSRPLGLTALCLLLTVGGGIVIARLTQPPRVLVVMVSVLALTYVYHGLLGVTIAATQDLSLDGLSFTTITISAVLNMLLAGLLARSIMVVRLRMTPVEHVLR